MLTRRRIILAISIVVIGAIGWSAWLAVKTAQDLRAAQASAERLQEAVTSEDLEGRTEAFDDLEEAAASAEERTAGIWWTAMTKTPFVGDDLAGVRALSSSLDRLATGALPPLSETLGDLDSVTANGGFDISVIEAIRDDVVAAHRETEAAADVVASQDSSGFAGVLRTRYDDYADTIADLAGSLGSAETAVDVLPTMLGRDEKRIYLLIFENNAEIRATGGLPGSWALVEANDGKLDMTRQGAATDFKQFEQPVGGVSAAEAALFGPEMGRFFQDPNFTPDFPRAAEVFDAFWRQQYPDETLDGVVSIDVVGLSYLLKGLGPVAAEDLTLTSDNVVDVLLRGVYSEPDPAKQDEIFRTVARKIFEAAIDGPQDPVSLLSGIGRAAREGRFHVAPFDADEAEQLAGTRVEAALTGDDGVVPHVDIAMNDATGSKMSYYLRYDTDVRSVSCTNGVQLLQASVRLSQTIDPAEAANLPAYVTGLASAGARPGEQVVRVHVFAPFGGSLDDFRIDGKAVATPQEVTLNGRPAVTFAVLLDSLNDVVISIEAKTGTGQSVNGIVQTTPSVAPGPSVDSFDSSCEEH